MNLLDEINRAINTQEKAIATITGQRGGGKVVAKTLGGATVILTGEMATGKVCFYDRKSGRILSEAPQVSYSEYGV